jgi:hypothetical protein
MTRTGIAKDLKSIKHREDCVYCGRNLVYSEEIAKKIGQKGLDGCYICDGWYCPVCDY